MQDPRFLEIGQEQSQRDYKGRIVYDYCHLDGDLFFCIADSLVKARKKRDKWIKSKK